MLGSLILLGSFLAAADAGHANPGALAARVRQLVVQLDSPELARRQAAEEELLKLGPPVLEFLPATVEPGKAEVAQRVGRIRQKLLRAQAALGVQPSRVTLRGTMPLERALASLGRQTGNKISTARLDSSAGVLKRPVDVDFQQTPFWPALDRLLGEAGLDIYPYGENGSIEIVAPAGPRPAPGRGYVRYAGPFRFQLVSLVAERGLRPPETNSLKVGLEVAWEPRLAPISLEQHLADVQATDDCGNRIAIDTPSASLEAPVARGPIAARLLLPMALPPREVRAIARLRGTLWALVPGQVEQFRFTDLGHAQAAAKRMANVSVTLEGSSPAGKSLEVRLLVHFDQAGDALASHRTWVFNNPVYLQTRDKRAIAPVSVTPTRQTADEVGIAAVFPVDRPFDDYALVYQTPTVIFTAPLEYEFRNIPLP